MQCWFIALALSALCPGSSAECSATSCVSDETSLVQLDRRLKSGGSRQSGKDDESLPHIDGVDSRAVDWAWLEKHSDDLDKADKADKAAFAQTESKSDFESDEKMSDEEMYQKFQDKKANEMQKEMQKKADEEAFFVKRAAEEKAAFDKRNEWMAQLYAQQSDSEKKMMALVSDASGGQENAEQMTAAIAEKAKAASGESEAKKALQMFEDGSEGLQATELDDSQAMFSQLYAQKKAYDKEKADEATYLMKKMMEQKAAYDAHKSMVAEYVADEAAKANAWYKQSQALEHDMSDEDAGGVDMDMMRAAKALHQKVKDDDKVHLMVKKASAMLNQEKQKSTMKKLVGDSGSAEKSSQNNEKVEMMQKLMSSSEDDENLQAYQAAAYLKKRLAHHHSESKHKGFDENEDALSEMEPGERKAYAKEKADEKSYAMKQMQLMQEDEIKSVKDAEKAMLSELE